MYQIKPILTKQEIDLPSCMYKIKPVVESLHSDSANSAGKSVNLHTYKISIFPTRFSSQISSF